MDGTESHAGSMIAPVSKYLHRPASLHGTEDKATRPAGSQLFHDKAGSTDKTLKFYRGYYHDCLNDLGKEMVMADILGWPDAHL